MKVEHHVTIHSGLNIHAPVFAESREEAERLGREWALALLTKTPPADAFFEPPDRLLYVRCGRCCPELRLRQVRRHRDPPVSKAVTNTGIAAVASAAPAGTSSSAPEMLPSPTSP